MRIPRLNQVILIIIFAEFLFTAASGLITPLFAVFILDNIEGSALTVIGFATAIYWVTKSILQLPIARQLDKNHGEIDDYYSMLGGVFLMVLIVYTYYFIHHVWQVYLLQFLAGVADAFVVPPFYAIFTRHIDKGKEAFEWALFSSFSMGAGSALGAVLGGVLGTIAGFRSVFPVVGILSFVATIMLVFLKPYILPKVPSAVPRIFIEK